MSIREDSKRIIRYFLAKAIESGDLHEDFHFQYNTLAAALELQSGEYCHVCCQYLNGNCCIELVKCSSRKDPDSKDIMIRLTSRAVDFLESST